MHKFLTSSPEIENNTNFYIAMASRQHFDTGETHVSRHKDVFLEMKLMRIRKVCTEMDKIYDSKTIRLFFRTPN